MSPRGPFNELGVVASEDGSEEEPSAPHMIDEALG